MNDTFDPSKFAGGSVPVNTSAEVDELQPAVFSPQAFAQLQLDRQAAFENRLKRLREQPLGPLRTWSFSAITTFEECAYRSYLSRVEGYKEPASPAMERGNQVHKAIEDFIQGETDVLCKEAQKFAPRIHALRERYMSAHNIEIEQEWAFDRNWQPTVWSGDDTWTRMKLDVFERDSNTSAKVTDWKTGRKFGNEMKHSQQLQLYAIAAFLRYPELEFVEGEMVYLDKNDTLADRYTREEAMTFIDRWTYRGLKMTTATEFPANPGSACRWCPHGKIQDGADKPVCPYAKEV